MNSQILIQIYYIIEKKSMTYLRNIEKMSQIYNYLVIKNQE